jgi:hypothetical protein
MPKGIDRAPVVLVTGDDESVIRDTVVLIDRHLVGEADRDSCLEELTLGAGLDATTQITVEHVVAAAQTPAFLTRDGSSWPGTSARSPQRISSPPSWST